VSKSVRLKDYLADELEKIAARENRSLTNLVNHLLEQAIEMERAMRKSEERLSQGLFLPSQTEGS
jgi:predicted DNA-binding ribbon-helix-helix protein